MGRSSAAWAMSISLGTGLTGLMDMVRASFTGPFPAGGSIVGNRGEENKPAREFLGHDTKSGDLVHVPEFRIRAAFEGRRYMLIEMLRPPLPNRGLTTLLLVC